MTQLKIVMLGAGNLAFHFSKALIRANHQIIQVYSRTINSAQILADQINAQATNNLQEVNNEADLYVIAVSDKAISQLVNDVDFKDKKVVHTAGSVPISVFNIDYQNFGVFYPLQSFSKSRNINFKKIPVCIEANNQQFELFLFQLASQLTESVWKINSPQRRQLHLAAVFANNFVNHLYCISKDIASKADLDFNILKPLIQETASKIMELDPDQAQTGPAVRNDKESLEKHLELLSSWPEYQIIYKLITESIQLKNRGLQGD